MRRRTVVITGDIGEVAAPPTIAARPMPPHHRDNEFYWETRPNRECGAIHRFSDSFVTRANLREKPRHALEFPNVICDVIRPWLRACPPIIHVMDRDRLSCSLKLCPELTVMTGSRRDRPVIVCGVNYCPDDLRV